MISRRRVLLFSVGMIAALGGSAVTTYLRARHCGEAGGSWDLAKRSCSVAFEPRATESLVGVAVTIALAFLIYRGATLALKRGGMLSG